MEYIIIIALFIFLILLIFIKQIIYSRGIYQAINKNSLIKSELSDSILMNYNPLNLWVIQSLYKEFKQINKYDLKSYITFSKLDINPRDRFLLDWYTIIYGISDLFYDSILHISKRYKVSYYNKLQSLNNIYIKLFIKILENNHKINKSKLKLNINKHIKKYINKYISKLESVYNIIYLRELLFLIKDETPFFKLKQYYLKHKHNKNSIRNEAIYNAGKIIINIKSKNYNSIINNRIKNIYLTIEKSALEPFYLALN